MAIAEILRELDAEISKLQQVRKLLANGRSFQPGGLDADRGSGRKKRRLSVEARKKIADAQRKRWAAQRAKK